MIKRVLMVATIPSTIGMFNMNNIHILHKLGYEVDVAADFNDTSAWPADRIDEFKKELKVLNVNYFQIDFSRSIFKIGRHISSYKEMVKLILDRQYTFIHTHTPVASAIVRLAARKTGTRVIYTAHGFHFFKGAPLKNWIIFYPIEKILSKYTEVLITINKEDFNRASKKFKSKKTVYIPGVGLDTKFFSDSKTDKSIKRLEFGLDKTDFVMISVGELNDNKNHKQIIKLLPRLAENIKYVIVGQGILHDYLINLADKLGVKNRLVLTGYRNDVRDLLSMADCFVFPSKREGLGLAALEGMSAGLPVIGHNVGGIKDFVVNEETGWLCKNAKDYLNAIINCSKNNPVKCIDCIKKASQFDCNVTNSIMEEVYKSYE